MVIRVWTNRRVKYLAVLLAAMMLQWLLIALPGFGAERVFVSFGAVEYSVAVANLESFARTGELPNELRSLGRFLTDEQLDQLRTGLTVSADVDVVTISQFLYSSQGEAALQLLGDVVQTAGRQNGALAIRAALILAAADGEGQFNALNILNRFPTEGARVDLQRLSTIARTVITALNETEAAVAQIQQQAELELANAGTANVNAVNLLEPGPERWQVQSLNQLTLPTDLYLPNGQNAPLIVISHGLGGDRTTFADLAQHLASYGFAIAVVEHPGSSAAQLEALLTGITDDVIEPAEMIRRPLAIQTLLDELEIAAQDPAIGDHINLQQVGVLGQSLGGYTSLALAGATVQNATLEPVCPVQTSRASPLNLSLLLQCAVLDLPQPLPPLADPRIQAAIAVNPLDSAVFGPVGMANIAVPTMLVSGSADTVTPALSEQIRPFTWLESAERYLLLMENGTHFSTIYEPDPSAASIPVPLPLIGPAPEEAQRYLQAMSVAFFKTHLAEENAYHPYLNQAAVQALSDPDLPISLVQDFTLDEELPK
ncbi:MAG: alpha/beta hydrolase [Leptolyngbya sp. SIOISBB]|nr:alpha/beta hydrolase [Leptolyngbya sp. SIOISBB]